MQFDPAAALRCWAIDVDLGGRTYTIEARPAADWLLAVLGPRTDIVPGLIGDPGDLDDLIADGTVDSDELRQAAQDAVAAASGMKWWVAEHMAQLAASTWVGREVLLSGLDPAAVSLGAYLGACYHAAARNMNQEQRTKFDLDLTQPPTGVEPEEWFDEDEAAAGFMAALAGGTR